MIGGGAIGSAIACFLARDFGARVTVVERDPSYRDASSARSASSIRQQFSTEINIRLSQASLAFYRRIGEELAVGGERPRIGLVEPGYLLLATDAGAARLRANHALQRSCGVEVVLLAPREIERRFPWLSSAGIALGSLGLSTATSGEGWFDGYQVLQAFRRKAIAHGARYLAARAQRWRSAGERVLELRLADGTALGGDAFVIAAGAWSAPLARALGFDLPVRARKRDVFVFASPVELPHCPLVVDPSGLWFRPEGRLYLCGAPPRGEDRDDEPLEAIEHGLFDEWIWPRLAARVSAFETLRRTSAWAGYYELNTFDANGLVGTLPGAANAYLACGFSGHGLQQAPAVGRAVAELVATGAYRTLDLSALAPSRIGRGAPLVEANVI